MDKINYHIDIKTDKTMIKAIEIIKFDIENDVYENMNWSSFVSTALLTFCKMLGNGIKPIEFEYFLKTHSFSKGKSDA